MKYFFTLVGLAILAVFFCVAVAAQSRDQNFPTGIETAEISGAIKARDVGDSRLTSYYYAFDGSQGDVFVNVVTKNFSGDIDVFTRDVLKPLSKMVIFGDPSQQTETGRVIYLRKSERLILRVQGRTPNDEPAAFRIKFAGSFVAVKERAAVDEPTIARETTGSGSTVNSVGTLVAVQPNPAAAPARAADIPAERVARTVEPKTALVEKPPSKPDDFSKKSEVVVKSSIKEPTTIRTAPPKRTTATRKSITPPAKLPPAPDPLASINLKIELKEGGEILRPLNEVLRFSVDKGVLTVILKTGAVSRYSMVTEVSKVTIE